MKFLKGLILATLLTSYGCTTVKYVETKPPEFLLQECQVYGLEGSTVEDAIVQSLKNKASLDECNFDKKKLRQIYHYEPPNKDNENDRTKDE